MSNIVYHMAFKQLNDHTVHIQGSYEQKLSHYMWTATSLVLAYHLGAKITYELKIINKHSLSLIHTIFIAKNKKKTALMTKRCLSNKIYHHLKMENKNNKTNVEN